MIFRYRNFQVRPFDMIVQLNFAARLILTIFVRACFCVVILSALSGAGCVVVAMLVGGWEGATTDGTDVRVHPGRLRLTLLLVEEVSLVRVVDNFFADGACVLLHLLASVDVFFHLLVGHLPVPPKTTPFLEGFSTFVTTVNFPLSTCQFILGLIC